MKKPVSNLSHSIQEKLRQYAKGKKRPYQEILQYYAMERFLYRLGCSQFKNSLFLKGALMFVVWGMSQTRPTADIDFLGQMDGSIKGVTEVIKQICGMDVHDDGIIFKRETVRGKQIKENADYEGVRVRFVGYLGKMRIPMQIDVAFGDKVFPKVQKVEYPVILDMSAPSLEGYPPETVIAEKFEAMIRLDMLNSRMKDFYDVWMLASQFKLKKENLLKAIQGTFSNRGTGLPSVPILLFDELANDKEKNQRWRAFLRTSKLTSVARDFKEVVFVIKNLLELTLGLG